MLTRKKLASRSIFKMASKMAAKIIVKLKKTLFYYFLAAVCLRSIEIYFSLISELQKLSKANVH